METTQFVAMAAFIALFLMAVGGGYAAFTIMQNIIKEQRDSQDYYIKQMEVSHKSQIDALMLFIDNQKIEHEKDNQNLKDFIQHIVNDFKAISEEQLRTAIAQNERFLKDMQAWILLENDRKDEGMRRAVIEAIKETLQSDRQST